MNAFITPVSVLDLETVSFLTLRSDTLHTRKASNDTDVFLSIRCQFRAPVILANDRDTRLKIRRSNTHNVLDDVIFLAGQWWVEEDLNLRPHAYQACALTT